MVVAAAVAAAVAARVVAAVAAAVAAAVTGGGSGCGSTRLPQYSTSFVDVSPRLRSSDSIMRCIGVLGSPSVRR